MSVGTLERGILVSFYRVPFRPRYAKKRNPKTAKANNDHGLSTIPMAVIFTYMPRY